MFKEFPRVDIMGKITGQAKYAEDIKLPDMTYGAMVRSPHPHARIKNIDKTKAIAMPGVLGVLTAEDIPGIAGKPKERPVLVPDVVCYVGDGVAMVVAESQSIARDAAKLVEVEYEILPAVFDPEEALKEGAPIIHGDSNLEKSIKVRRGDVEKGFAEADVIFEKDVSTHRVQHVTIEPEAALGVPEADGVVVHCPSKSPFNVRRVIAETLGISLNNVRLISSVVGGSFGGKDYDMSVLGSRVALAAAKFGRPCRMVYDREGSIAEGTKRHPYRMHYKVGAKKDGKITAMEVKILSDAGSYLSKSAMVGWRSAVEAAGTYDVPNVKTDLYVIYTNLVSSDALRGFGSPQVDYASEVVMSAFAKELGIDPLEFRRINMLKEGDVHASGQTLTGVTIDKCLEALENRLEYKKALEEIKEFNAKNKKNGKVRGLGISALHRGEALGAGGEGIDTAGVNVHVERDGSIIIYAGLSEVGQGCQSMMARIVSEMLGVKPARCRVSRVDTDYVPDSGPTVASRGTVLAGNATTVAVKEIKDKLAQAVAQHLWVKPMDIEFKDERVFVKDQPGHGVSFDEAVSLAYGQCRNVYGNGWWAAPKLVWDWEKGQGEAYFSYVYGACGAIVEVDLGSGKTDVIKFIAVHDVGIALNIEEVYGQICGGVAMGIGYGTSEELGIKDGVIKNNNLDSYIIPTAMDIGTIEPVILQEYSTIGPLGAKGLGEPVTSIVAPAITNAISNAIGVHIYNLPANLEQVLALSEGEI